jgi:hypothetical protein
MANLTLRSVKGSPLTNAELDGNFEYFTGSHAITGSLTVSGSIIPAEVNGTLGTAEHPWKELFIDGATIVFISGSSSGSVSFTSGSGFNFVGGPLTLSGSSVVTSNQTGSFVTSGSSASTGSNNFTGTQTITGSLIVTGSLTVSGSNTFINVGPAQFSGSTETTQIDPLTDFWTNTFRPSKIQESSFAFTLGNSAYDGGVNPQLYTFNSRIVLPWTKKVKSYFISNTLSGSSNLIANQLILPPLSNTGHTPGDVVSVYNMSNASFYDSGKIYLTSGMHGVTSVNASTKVIDGTYNNTALLSGSWGNYTNINVSNNPATSQSLALNPGQKATFEIIQWGDAISTPTAASASVTPGFGSTTYSANGYGDSQSVSPAIVYTLVYKLVSVSNL